MMKCKHRLALLLLLGAAFSLSADWTSFSQSFNQLSTIAGKGVLGGGGANYWLPASEGAPAATVELSNPHFAMADGAGNIYIADKEAHAIRKVDLQGKIWTAAGTNVAGDGGDGKAVEQSLSSPNGLWVSKNGVLYILDLGNSKIRKVTSDGNMTTVFHDSAGISLGRGLWVSATEDTIWYSSGTQIKQWTRQAGIVPFATGFSGLGNIVQDRNGFIVATDRTANRVYRIDAQGQKTVIAGNGNSSATDDGLPALETAFYGVRGVWFLDDNSYFLGTHEGSRIWYVDTLGIAHLFLDGREGDEYHSGDNEHYRTPGSKVSEVRAVTVDYQGNVLITENDRGFVRKIEKTNVAVQKILSSPGSLPLDIHVASSPGMIRCLFTIDKIGSAELRVHDGSGRLVDVLTYANLSPGVHSAGLNSLRYTSGVYTATLRSAGSTVTKKIVLFK